MLIRFKKNDGTEYPQWEEKRLGAVLKERNQKNCKDGTYEHVSLTKEGVIPKTDRYNRDFLVRNEDKEYKITKLNDICYNPANLKFGVICRNKYGNGIFSPIYITFEIDNAVNPVYMEYFLTRADFINYALKYQQGTVYERMAVSPTDLLSINIKLPSIEEQQKIADFLSTVDHKIDKQKSIVADYEELKKGTMQKIFNQELRFRDDNGNEFPAWNKTELGELCEPHARIGWQNLRTDEFLQAGDYYLITGTDFKDGKIDFSKCHYISKERYEQDKKLIVKNENILITKDGTLGKIALIKNLDKQATLNAGVFVLNNLSNIINNEYLYFYLIAPFLLDFAAKCSTGGTIKHLNQGVLIKFPIKIPCLEEQKKIADCLSALDRKIEAEKKILADLEELKKGLLQGIFNN